MHKLGDLYPNQVINVSYGFDGDRLEEKGSLMHMIGFATTKENPYADLEMLAIEEHTWAIFPNKGPFPQTLQDTWGENLCRMASFFRLWVSRSSRDLFYKMGRGFQ